MMGTQANTKKNKTMWRPIFISGAHKSGTSLLRSLFDGHPELFVLPIETQFHFILNWWTRYPLRSWEKISDWDINVFRRSACEWVEVRNRIGNKLADSDAKGIFNLELFKKAIESIESTDDSNLIRGYFEALYQALFNAQMPEHMRVVEKTVGTFEHAARLKKLYPEAVFFHVIRNPYANLVTLRKYLQTMDKGFPHLDKILRSLQWSYFFAEENKYSLDDYFVVKYEDLVTKPEEILHKLAEQAGIQFHSTLLQPTFLGNAWGGNSVTGNTFTGISKARLKAWQQEITALEVELINRHLKSALITFDYKVEQPESSPWRRVRREGLKAYIANRVLLKRG